TQDPARCNFTGGTLATDGAINVGGQTFVMNGGTLASATPTGFASFNSGNFDYKGGAVTGNGLRLYNACLNFDGGSSGTFIFRTTGLLTGGVPAGSNATVAANNESSPGSFGIAATNRRGGHDGTTTLPAGGTAPADGVHPGDGGAITFTAPAPDDIFDFKSGSVTGSGLRLYQANLMFDGGSSGTFIFRSAGNVTLGAGTLAIPAGATL